MKIVVATDSFKGTNSSLRAAGLMIQGAKRVFTDAEYRSVAVADGGEGTVDAILGAADGERITTTVTGPLGKPVESFWGYIADSRCAVIEMAAAAGLPMLSKEERNPLITTTRGVGELIGAALDAGAKQIVIGMGGSATNDGGVGMAQALGYSFRDKNGVEIGAGGGALAALTDIDADGRDRRLDECEILLASDVTNPLTGERGASAVYGPQKGATPEMIKTLDDNLDRLQSCVRAALSKDMQNEKGAGAAGGLGYGMMVFADARPRSGIDTVLDTIGFDDIIADADLIITGEGKIDGQSINGKVPVGIAARAKKYNLPTLAIVGDIGDNIEAVYPYGLDSVMSTVNRAMPLEEALRYGSELMVEASERAMRMIAIGMKLNAKKGYKE